MKDAERRQRPLLLGGALLLALAWSCAEAAAGDGEGAVAPTLATADHAIVPGYERLFQHQGADRAAGGLLLLGELGCTACHQPGREAEGRIDRKPGPILDRVGTRVRAEHLRGFLNDPPGVRPGTTMPDLLGGLEPADRSAVVDRLTHFLASTGGLTETRPDPRAIGRGRTLFRRVGCLACHDAVEGKAAALSTSKPLGDLAAKYTVASLSAFLADPLKARPSGRMPSLALTAVEAADVASYLLRDLNREVPPTVRFRYYEGHWERLPDLSSLKPSREGLAAGLDLTAADRTNQYAFRFETFLQVERAGEYTFHLRSDDGSRLSLDDKEVIENDGIHPAQEKSAKVLLTKGMHRLVASYFDGGGETELDLEYEGPGLQRQPITPALSLTEEPPRPDPARGEVRFRVDPDLAARGRELFATIGCASCHSLQEGTTAIASRFSSPRLSRLEVEAGCLDPADAKVGRLYRLTPRQREDLKGAVRGLQAPITGDPPLAATVARTLAAFNCYACHRRGAIGGVEDTRNASFETTQKEMGDEGRIPPHLDGVGAKLAGEYLAQVLRQGAKDRPYMLTRMPKFGARALEALPRAFASLDAIEPVPAPEFDEPPRRVKSSGRFLSGGQALGCIKCHTFKGIQAEGVQAIDMTIMTRRLRRDWFHRYLLDPQAERPGTRMPTAWPKGVSLLPKVLGGDTRKQIEAIWRFLADGNNADEPYGLGRQPIPLVARDEPILYRNFIKGAGPRAIAVGYPEKANLAFDANEFRIALIWQGAFIDASRHWSGRGEGFQGPLGDNVLDLPRGATLARLPTLTQAWPASPPKEEGGRFLGYRLDPKGRPTFSYEMGGIHIDDFPEPVAAADLPRLRRTLTLTSQAPPGDLWFRAAVAGRIEPEADGWFAVDREWKVRISPGEAITRTSAGKTELLAPVRFKGPNATIREEIRW